MSRRFCLLLVIFCATTVRADFNSLVRAVETSRGMHRVWTPGISLARLAVRIVHPSGVHDFQVAIFEGQGVDFPAVIRSTPGAPMVRSHDSRTGETAVIWTRPLGSELMEMLLLAHDPNDQTVVMRAVIDGEMLARTVADPRHASRIAQK